MISRSGLHAVLLCLALMVARFELLAANVLVPAGSVWKYLPVTNDIGDSWRYNFFDDSPWPQGPAQLGYGDQDEVTVVPFVFGQDGGKNISTYFRHSFSVTNKSQYTNLLVRLLRDDGAVVYLNGAELFRNNMPTGVVTHATSALSGVFSPEENTVFIATNVPPAELRNGQNLLAVEIHQVAPTSADISFDLELIGEAPASRPPLVALTAPFLGAALVPGTDVAIDATATDPDGSIVAVEFFADGLSIGTDHDAPFSLVWSKMPPGPHTLMVTATDDTGVTTSTDPLLIRVGGFSLINAGSRWNYLDDQTGPGVAWRAPGFDDTGWSNGVAPLGFGDGDEATVIRWKIAELPIITAYFRRQFVCPDPANFSAVMLRLLRDDGAVVYLNGVEVFRSNMPAGPVSYTTYALESVGTGPEESVIFFPTNLPPNLFVEGTNTLAVEVHQITQFSSTDLSFDCELTAFTTDAATRLTASRLGPELELAWPAWTDRFSLMMATNLVSPIPWTSVPLVPSRIDDRWTLRLPIVNDGPRLFRLEAP